MDIDNMDGTDDSRLRPNAPRLFHRKSRSGCLTCKRRRVKCDEKRPSCSSCHRHGVGCAYPSPGPSSARREGASPAPSSQARTGRSPSLDPLPRLQAQQSTPSPFSGSTSTSSATPGLTPESAPAVLEPANQATPFYYPPYRPPPSTDPPTPASDPSSSSIPDPPESRDRRLWELRLLHNYIETIASNRQPDALPPISFQWLQVVPRVAFQDPATLYAILAQSALNLSTLATSPQERSDMRTLQSTYLGMALREQRAGIASLTRSTADRVCMASLVILHHAYALVQTTVLDDDGAWQPPLEWLRIGRGTGKVWTVARSLLTAPDPANTAAAPAADPSREARIQAFLSSPPHFDMDDIFTEANRAPYLWLLDDPRHPPDAELSDKVTRSVYESALSYVGWTARAVAAGEAEWAVQRRLAAFAVWMSDLFQDFCQQRRPRALVVLAWFFRLWIPYSHRWEVGGVGEGMVRGIYGVLEERWRGKLEPIFREHGW